MNFVLVGVGGALGSITRYSLGKLISDRSKSKFPLGTFIINITGALLLGLLSSADVSSNLYMLLGDGFLGAYTTFSTFMYEGFSLFQENRNLNALVYIFSSLILGIIGFSAGFYFGVVL